MDKPTDDTAWISCPPEDVEVPRRSENQKWTPSFWAILKFMCLFYHRVVVPRKRVCFSCSVDRFRKRSRAGVVKRPERYDAELDPLLVAHEYPDAGNKPHPWDVESRGEMSPLVAQPSPCPVCDALWWNRDGVTERYTEREIGVGRWNHRGSGALSSLLLLGALTLITYDIVNFMRELWGQPDLILKLMKKMTLYIVLLVYPLLSLCSKLRSLLTSRTPSFQWASALNARYLVKQAQVLDIGIKGLPQKLFFLFCMATPLLTAVYRFLIFTVISGCGFRTTTILTSIVGIIFNQAFGLYLYLFHLLRVSFQRQFNLLTLYIRDHEGEEKRCRGAFFSTVVDFHCFKGLVNLSIFVMFPAFVFAISSNLTYQYMLANSTCITQNRLNMNISHHNLRLAWSEIILSLGSYLVAIGGIQVDYVFNNFVTNLLHLRSSKHRIFWNTLIRDINHVTQDSYFYLVTIIFSFISIFLAFNFSSQDVTDLVVCNTTSIICV